MAHASLSIYVERSVCALWLKIPGLSKLTANVAIDCASNCHFLSIGTKIKKHRRAMHTQKPKRAPIFANSVIERWINENWLFQSLYHTIDYYHHYSFILPCGLHWMHEFVDFSNGDDRWKKKIIKQNTIGNNNYASFSWLKWNEWKWWCLVLFHSLSLRALAMPNNAMNNYQNNNNNIDGIGAASIWIIRWICIYAKYL